MKHLIIFFVGLFLLVLFFFFLLPKILVVRDITCQSQYGSCSQYVNDRLKNISGANLDKARKEIAGILKNNPAIVNYSFRFKLPSRIVVNTIERKSYVALFVPSANTYVLLDNQGTVINFAKESALPTVTINDGDLPALGDRVKENVLRASRLIEKLFLLYGVRSGNLKDSDLIIFFDLNGKRVKVYLSLEKDPDISISSLQLVVTQATIEGKDFARISEIDLRYKNPVVK